MAVTSQSAPGAIGTSTGSAILPLFNDYPTTITADLLVYYKLDEASGARVDSLGNADLAETGSVGSTPAIINDGAHWIGPAAIGNRLTTSIGTVLTRDMDFSYSCWVAWDDLPALAGAISSHIALNPETPCQIFSIDDRLTVDTFGGRKQTSTGFLQIGTFYHVVVVWRTADKAANVWIDGVDTGQGASPTSGATGSADLLLGGRGLSFPFVGKIDELGIWNRVLTDEEIATLYNNGNGISHPFDSAPDLSPGAVPQVDPAKVAAIPEMNFVPPGTPSLVSLTQEDSSIDWGNVTGWLNPVTQSAVDFIRDGGSGGDQHTVTNLNKSYSAAGQTWTNFSDGAGGVPRFTCTTSMNVVADKIVFDLTFQNQHTDALYIVKNCGATKYATDITTTGSDITGVNPKATKGSQGLGVMVGENTNNLVVIQLLNQDGSIIVDEMDWINATIGAHPDGQLNYFEDMIPAGETVTRRVVVSFWDKGGGDATSFQTVDDSRLAMRAGFPVTVSADRGAVGKYFGAQSANCATFTADNINGWLARLTEGQDMTTEAGQLTLKKNLIDEIRSCIQRVQDVGGQGVLFWDVYGEGGSQPNMIYLGIGPAQEAVFNVCPEVARGTWSLIAREVRNAGLRFGVCLRPQVFGPDTGICRFVQTDNDTFEEQYQQLYAKTKTCMEEWGASLFYVDTDVLTDNTKITPSSVYDRLVADFPGAVFIPEREPFPHFSGHLPLQESQSESHPLVRFVYPEGGYSSVVSQSATTQEVVDMVDRAHIPFFDAWYESPDYNAVVAAMGQTSTPDIAV